MSKTITEESQMTATEAAARNLKVRYIVLDRNDIVLSMPTEDYEKAVRIAKKYGAIVRIAPTVHSL